jgi:hypothetical protein
LAKNRSTLAASAPAIILKPAAISRALRLATAGLVVTALLLAASVLNAEKSSLSHRERAGVRGLDVGRRAGRALV